MEVNVENNVEPYQELANAIVLQAVKDYRGFLLCHKEIHKIGKLKKEAEEFFKSDWFRLLSNLNPDYLMTELNKLN